MDKLTEQRENRKQLLFLFDEIRRVSALCDPLYQQYSAIENEKLSAQAKTPIIAILGILFGAFIAFCGTFSILDNGFVYHTVRNGDCFNNVCLLVPVGVAILLVCIKYYKKIKMDQVGASKVIDQLNQTQNEILDKIDRFYGESTIADLYPQKYLFPDAIEYCYTLINDMRADSIKEAINLYEDIMYKERIEKSQREATETLKSIEKETSKARKAAQFAAVASGVSAYYTRKTHKAFKQYTK